MSRDQNAGQSQSMKTDNSSFERLEEFKYLGTTLTNENSIQEDIKSRMKSQNACYPSVQNLLSSSLLSKNLKIKIRSVLLTEYCAGGKIEKNEMGGACGTYGGRERGAQGSGGET